MFSFGFCFPKATEAVNSKMTDRRCSELIGYQMRSLLQNNCAVFITKHQSPKAFSFISIGYLMLWISQVQLPKYSHKQLH